MQPEPSSGRSRLASQLDLSELRYGMVWEDERVLVDALEIAPGDVVLSIGSAGDNALACLLAGAARVIAVDMSPSQVALMRLKLAALAQLEEHRDFAALLGFGSAGDAGAVFDRLRPRLDPELRAFWDVNRARIEHGLAFSGRLESYFARAREEIFLPAWGPELIERLLGAPDLSSQAKLFDAEADTPEVEAKVRWYFGPEMLARHGRSAAQMAFVETEDTGDYWYRRFQDVFRRFDARDNPWLEVVLRGGIRVLERGPSYLRPSRYAELRRRAGDIEVVQGELEQVVDELPAGGFSKANLSDLFEYMSQEETDGLFAALAAKARPGGRLAYWNLLVPRTPGPALRRRLIPHPGRARELWRRDRCWFYRSFHIDEIRSVH